MNHFLTLAQGICV